MLQKEVLNLILQDLPESIIFVTFCFVFLNLEFRWKKILCIAILLSLTDSIEILSIPSGIRVLMLAVALVVYFKIITRKSSLSKIFVAVFTVFLLESLGDVAWSLPLLKISGLSYVNVYSTPYLRALFSYPSLLTILLVTYFLYRYKRKKMINFE